MIWKNRHVRAFTLIELSVVLVVVGIVIGGIIAGKSIVNGAGRQSIVRDLVNYRSSIDLFRFQFNALPGDFDDASTFWSGANNGDGDGTIEGAGEDVYLFEHLGLAEIVDRPYTGTSPHEAGVSLPEAPFGGVYLIADTATLYQKKTGHSVSVARIGGGFAWAGFINAQNAYDIEVKLDDADPDDGVLFVTQGYDAGVPGFSGTCIDNNSVAVTGDFDFSSDDPGCALFYWFDP